MVLARVSAGRGGSRICGSRGGGCVEHTVWNCVVTREVAATCASQSVHGSVREHTCAFCAYEHTHLTWNTNMGSGICARQLARCSILSAVMGGEQAVMGRQKCEGLMRKKVSLTRMLSTETWPDKVQIQPDQAKTEPAR